MVKGNPLRWHIVLWQLHYEIGKLTQGAFTKPKTSSNLPSNLCTQGCDAREIGDLSSMHAPVGKDDVGILDVCEMVDIP